MLINLTASLLSDMAAHSPASSPRLPSPPPIAEDQIGPTSPGVSLYEDHPDFPGGGSSNASSNAAARRIRPGTKSDDMSEGPPLVDLQEIDSAFQLTEHLKALYYSATHPPDTDTITPITAAVAKQLTAPPPNTSRDIWLYELARFLIQKTNAILVALFQDAPPCSPHTCPEMRASEWQYLCAVHDPPKSCAAVDYCCHTLDWAATTLTSSKMFPSRLGLGSGSGGASGGNMGGLGGDKVLLQQMKEIKNIFRRVYRIYAHAWFQHREMFWRVEGKTGLYVFFKTVCDEYGIIEAENYTIPAEAEGLEVAEGEGDGEDGVHATPVLLQRDHGDELSASGMLPATSPRKSTSEESIGLVETTKRHRHTKSDFSRDPSAVIKEEAEEEEVEPLPAPVAEKPPLDRQETALREINTSEPESTREGDAQTEAESETPIEDHPQDEDGDDPKLGVTRSDTIKAEKESPVQEVGKAAGEPEEEDEQTVIETAEEKDVPAPKSEAEVPAESTTVAASDVETEVPQEQPAADGEVATKTVGD